MQKFFKKVCVATLTLSMGLTSLSTVWAEQPTQSMLSLGASLSDEQAMQTKTLLGAANISGEQTIYVDGNVINRYLADGSNGGTTVYSSALIEPQAEGYGVQVQIVTPQNITLVSPITYQNAAITSGAKDVAIKIATVSPVTGEGALAGVYALLEKSGTKVSQQAIKVAEKEIQIVEQAKKEEQLTDLQANQILADLKKEITLRVSNNEAVDQEIAKKIIQNILAKYKIDSNLVGITEFVAYALDFAKTEVAKNKETIKQLEESVDKSIWNEDKHQQLQAYMTLWGEAMNQEYTEYTPERPGMYYGVSIPTDIFDSIAVDGKKIEAEWAAQGIKPDVYNIVAAFADKEKEGMDVHLYLFAIHNGQSVVLHTQQNQGNDEGLVYFNETQNVDLKNNFAEIVKGTDAQYLTIPTEATESATTSALWNEEKRVLLQQFMLQWQEAMGQTYAEFTPDNPGEYYGDPIPSGIFERFSIWEGGIHLPVEWSYDGMTSGVYNVVACYKQMDQLPEDQGVIFPHLYLFVITPEGKPLVLHTEQTQGNPENALYFTPTENVALQAGFESIVNQ